MGRGHARKETGRIEIIIFIISLSALMMFTIFSPADAINIQEGEDAPDFILKSVNGKVFSLSDLKEKTVVFIYWRPDPKRSHLALQDGKYIAETFKDRGVQVLGLFAEKDNKEEVLKIIRDNRIDFPVLMDSYRDVYSDYGIRVYPTTVIIDKYGKMAHSIPGHALTYKIILEAQIKYLLGEINEEEFKMMISPRKEKIDESVLKAERRYNLALKLAESGLLDQAIETAQTSIEAGQNIAKPYILLGSLFLQKKETDKAIENFQRALELEPQSHNAKTGLGSSLLLKGDFDSAIAILEEAAVANPYPALTYYELGKAYELKGEKEKSLELYKKALDKVLKKNIFQSLASE